MLSVSEVHHKKKVEVSSLVKNRRSITDIRGTCNACFVFYYLFGISCVLIWFSDLDYMYIVGFISLFRY